MSIELVIPSSHFILCHPLLLSSIFPSIRVFSNESVLCIRWPKYWSFSFGFSPSNEYSELISFRMDWLDLLAVQGTLKSLLQHQLEKNTSSEASVLQCSAFFIVQLSYPYITSSLVETVNFSQLHVSSGCCVACCFLFVSPVSEYIPFPPALCIDHLSSRNFGGPSTDL